MRVTENTFSNNLLNQIGDLTNRQARLQNQAATGQRVTLPEDDPAAMRRVLDLQAEGRSVEQYGNNIDELTSQSDAVYQALRGFKRISDRAGELAVLSGGTKDSQQLKVYASEINQLIQEAAQLANTKYQGVYLFGGTRTDANPFAVSTDETGSVTQVTYQGRTDVAEVEVAENTTVSALVIGANTTGSGPRGLLADSRVGADFFNHLIALKDSLNSGNTDAITQTVIPGLNADEENLLLHIGQQGALQARLESTSALNKTRAQDIEVRISGEADADLAQTIVRLTQVQNAYQAALQSGARLLDQSLLDFIR